MTFAIICIKEYAPKGEILFKKGEYYYLKIEDEIGSYKPCCKVYYNDTNSVEFDATNLDEHFIST